MKLKLIILFFLCSVLCFAQAQPVSDSPSSRVIDDFAGKHFPVTLALSLEKQKGCDVYETSVHNGKLAIKASSGVALCRGFYDYVKSIHGGIYSWSGKRFILPKNLPEQAVHRVVSPYQCHFYFNPVTFGYTMPYWNWKRWDKEIDWMALHGIDMPLALVANEAISARVWKKLGLTDDEINEYFTGPAHLPWMRMGNISGVDSPLPEAWQKDQIALEHKILFKMKSLGMTPVCPGFAGFVPKAITRLYPHIKIDQTTWSGFHNWMISPDEPLFATIGKMFIQEWEKEFGKNQHYLIDSFNEMDIPFPAKGTPERYERLAKYGDEVYRALKSGNPDAVWVMQGWMFGYQRSIWDYESLKALLSKVPDNKMILLDMAEDHNFQRWKIGSNWDYYKGFFNKPWVYSFIPNMGGKNTLTGNLQFYIDNRQRAYYSVNRGNLVGYGAAPEGIENNEVVYELIFDGGWQDSKIDLKKWLDNYSLCRYGKNSQALESYWDNMQKSVYKTFVAHPKYNWQFRPGTANKGTVDYNNYFFSAIERFASATPSFKKVPLFVTDLTDLSAQYAGAKIDLLIQSINQAYLEGDMQKAQQLEQQFSSLFSRMDRVLEAHPLFRMERWVDFARMHGQTSDLKNYYEQNARRIVTIWGPPVDDYSSRLWSGLIRDYYLPRWLHYFESKRTGKPFDFATWERNWVERRTGFSKIKPYKNQVQACLDLIRESKKVIGPVAEKDLRQVIATWSPENLAGQWKEMVVQIPIEKIPVMDGILFNYIRGKNTLFIRDVVLEMDGKSVCVVSHIGKSGKVSKNNFYKLTVPAGATYNNSCQVHIVFKSEGQYDSNGEILLIEKSKNR